MGSVWVHIPGVSAPNPALQIARYTPTRNPPAADGTPGAPIESKRQGFIKVFPMSPHAGSDRLRETAKTPDGRDPSKGESNGYGMHNQARNGDMVSVVFMDGDPSRGFILGHVPKTAETDHVPSYGPVKVPAATGTGYSTDVLPGLNRGIEGGTTQRAATVLAQNLTDSGLVKDSLRGGGSSSSTRETPSRVAGWKTPGDPDTNMMGHQFVMDDHPDSQLMRLRTSKGAQVLLCDNGDFIYLSTCSGKTWVQIDDGGNVNVYAKTGINLHTEHDFNLSCDRNFNMNVGGNVNWIIEGDSFIRMNKGANITVGEGGGDLDITTINNTMFKVQGEFRLGAATGITAKSAKFIHLQSTENFTVKSAKQFAAQITNDTSFKVGGKFQAKSTGDLNLDTGGNLNATKNTLSLTGPVSDVFHDHVGANNDFVTDALDPNQADIPTQYSVMAPPQTSGPPTAPTATILTAAMHVPQHEPYAGHPAQNPGHSVSGGGAVNPNTIPSFNV